MAHLPVHTVVRVVIDLPYDEGRLLRLDLVPKELELLHQLVHVDLTISLLIHSLECAPQALQLLRLLELSSLTLSPLLLIVRLCTATRAREKADKAPPASRGRCAPQPWPYSDPWPTTWCAAARVAAPRANRKKNQQQNSGVEQADPLASDKILISSYRVGRVGKGGRGGKRRKKKKEEKRTFWGGLCVFGGRIRSQRLGQIRLGQIRPDG